jgi:hypothetical protein
MPDENSPECTTCSNALKLGHCKKLWGNFHLLSIIVLFVEADIPLNSQVFPSYVRHEHGVMKQRVLAKLKEKRALK